MMKTRWQRIGLMVALLLIGPATMVCEQSAAGNQRAGGGHQTATVVLNELQYHPFPDDRNQEYVELYNAGPTTVDLSGWRLTDGVEYTFPLSVTLPPGGYLVVAHQPATVEARYGITGTWGPFTDGSLANEGERIALVDAAGTLVDEVTYDDAAPWPDTPDGDGPALELLNPAFDNNRPCSWGASSGAGTPGARNSVYTAGNIPPCITDVAHTPALPTSTQPVTVTAWVDDNGAIAAVTLYYRRQGLGSYSALSLRDDGTAGDVTPEDARYTTVIPPQPAGHYVEFYLTATDSGDAQRSVPAGAPGTVSSETGLPITVSDLYLVEDTPPTSTLPLYRLLLTDENRAELTTRPLTSNLRLDATFVYGSEVFYNVGIRYRGDSRDLTPRPYRIKFRDEHEFQGRERINLISDHLGREALAHDLFARAGLPASTTRFVTLYINAAHEGDYLDVEAVDRDFLSAHFPGDDGGNLYRGLEQADLSYRGPEAGAYRPYYLKKTNELTDDYADVIALTAVLSNTPDAALATAGGAVADLREWSRWLAIQAVLDNHEGALWIGRGDDYYLYRRPSDQRFILLSWDHDTTFLLADHSIWEPYWLGPPVIARLLREPLFMRWYYQDVAGLAANEFSVAQMFPRIEALPAAVGSQEREELRTYVTVRVPALLAQIPTTRLSITTHGGSDFATDQPAVTLEGDCSPLRDVTINGSAAAVTYPTATTWRATVALGGRVNAFTVADGQDTRTLTVTWNAFHGGTLTADTTLYAALSPYLIDEDIVVPAGLTLTIEPGVILQFTPDRTVRVVGRLLAEGTAARPIVFTRRESGYWGGILFEGSGADNRIGHAVVEYTREVISAPRTHGLSAYGARLTVADSILRHTQTSNAVIGYESTVTLLRNEIYDIQSDAVHLTGGEALVQGNTIHDARWSIYPYEGLELSAMVIPARVLDNRIYAISDDCIDMNHSSAILERNLIHHCGDKGISIGDVSSSTLTNNLVYACGGVPDDPEKGFGVAVKDSATAYLMNNTLVGNKTGLGLYEVQEGHTGRGAGRATVVNTILWGNTTAILLDVAHGAAITVTYSDVQGGWPGAGNLDADPLFRAPAGGDYRLQPDSPCVDTATPEGAPAVDLGGIPRPHDHGYDRGAYEFFEFFVTHLPLVMRSW